MNTESPLPRPLSDALLRTLRVCAAGKDASLQRRGMSFAVLCGLLVERGLVRSVKHRDHTRTYTPTDLGKVILASESARKTHGE